MTGRIYNFPDKRRTSPLQVSNTKIVNRITLKTDQTVPFSLHSAALPPHTRPADYDDDSGDDDSATFIWLACAVPVPVRRPSSSSHSAPTAVSSHRLQDAKTASRSAPGNETFNAYPPLPNDGTFSTFIESVIFGAIKIRNMGIGSQN
ncbi:hypothetical protein QTP88_011606 [Uroleucon formosanum]